MHRGWFFGDRRGESERQEEKVKTVSCVSYRRMQSEWWKEQESFACEGGGTDGKWGWTEWNQGGEWVMRRRVGAAEARRVTELDITASLWELERGQSLFLDGQPAHFIHPSSLSPTHTDHSILWNARVHVHARSHINLHAHSSPSLTVRLCL